MRRFGLVLAVTLFLPSCVRVEYREYRGLQDWPTGSAFVGRVEGVEVYEGLPHRSYEVIGLVDVYSGEPFENSQATREVLDFVDVKDAHALIWLSDRILASGSLHMGHALKEPASIDSGRSSQPEMLITNVGQYTQTSTKRALRSTLLLIQWKTN